MKLIDSEKLVETLRDSIYEYGNTGGSWGSMMPDVCAMVREEPAVEVVKCGECRFSAEVDGDTVKCMPNGTMMLRSEFCSRGKKANDD